MIFQELHANWQFQAPDESWRAAQVPGCIHTDLLTHNLIPNPFYGRNEFDLQWMEERDWRYQLRFVAEEELFAHEVIELVFDGLDTVAAVHLNGAEILRSENMFHRHRVPVMEHLQRGENLLEITFGSAMDYIRSHRTDFTTREFNDPIGNCVRIRKQQCQFGWDWGPRLVTCGVWRAVRLEAWAGNRLETVRIAQHHEADAVTLKIAPQLAREAEYSTFRATLSLNGETVAQVESEAESLQMRVENPQLWWPAGQGAQTLYDVHIELLHEGRVLSEWKRRIGLRTIELDMADDGDDVKSDDGRKLNRFGFRVNGRLIFCKGANWIPAHSFVAGLSRADYEPLLRAMTDVHMNMIRLWGGGIYESEDFYDLCDELGLMVWHDFMFACNLYPSDAAFLESVAREAADQVTRIRHRASLALWCGNNESAALNGDILKGDADKREGYRQLFLETLPRVLSEYDDTTSYIHSSPLIGVEGVPESFAPSLDAHDWNVWHSRAPVTHYETTRHRFNSEFGMQSYPSPPVAATFCPSEELNILSPTFEAHQKNDGGNATIFHYVAQLYRYPRDYAALSYVSQLNQAHCMKTAIEHFRRSQPQCLGALYWQVNDCWPVASWSSIEFGGNWKALHYAARRFFAPSLVSIQLRGEDRAAIGNRRHNTRGHVELWTVHDAPRSRDAILRWQLSTLDGQTLERGEENTALHYGEAALRQQLSFEDELARVGKENAFLLATLCDAQSGEELSRNTAFFIAPRFLNLQKNALHIERISPTELALSTQQFAASVCIAPQNGVHPSDNYFDLLPGETRHITLHGAEGKSEMPQVFSLAETF